MDLLILDRVLAALDGTLRGAVLLEVQEDAPGRFRMLFGPPEGGAVPVLVGLDPAHPWIGRPAPRRRERRPRRSPHPFAAACTRALKGAALRVVERLGEDRVAVLRLSTGHAVVAELVRGPTLVLVSPDGEVLDAARVPRASAARLAAGAPYAAPPLPEGRLPALAADPDEVDHRVRARTAGGEPLEDALRRVLLGIGPETAGALAGEALLGTSPGAVLARRRRRLAAGEDGPCIVGPADPLREAEAGQLDLAAFHLLPWAAPGEPCRSGADAAATAGLYHEAADLAGALASRLRGLLAILGREIVRVAEAERRAGADAASFADPERHGRLGEALLAGLARARRDGDVAWVPDPYDPGGRPIAVPAPAGRSLADAAQAHFARQRRARRGLAGAKERAAALASRRARLEQIAAREAALPSAEAVEALAGAMRREGIAVDLARAPDSRPAGRAGAAPRLEGVRLYSSSEGFAVLVGRTGRDNARLTFKLAAAEDFWLHARGVPGAHVVVRNPERRKTLPPATLREAAALAAWFSDAKTEAQADVQVARRKDVRAVRGAPPGTVILKRSITLRVHPELPRGLSEGGAG
ncbi:MAG TPA: NFACT RNA binding domain-containing protein [Candidatus Polarisedimenticolaceae bacterium]|nr:NFACT RNA binding domain-containing protein [Candidatus Polarisedimenticolaceae bacterium]